MAYEMDKLIKKRIPNPKAPDLPGLPTPGPGRPKGSPDGPKSKRAQKARVAKMLSYLDQMAKLRGGDVAQWLHDLCNRNPEFERWLAETYVRSNMPDAMDPDTKEVALAHAAAAGQEGGKGGTDVRIIMGDMSKYALGITAPAETMLIGEAAVLEDGALPAEAPEPVPEPKGEGSEGGTWES